MSSIAITTEDLGKCYQMGMVAQPYLTFRDALTSLAKAPFRRLAGAGGAANKGTFWALRHASLQIQKGEVMGIIGRNGAGKSTLLKILSRITEPTEGTARMRGRMASLLEVGTGFHQELTGRENIYLNGAILGMRKNEIDRKFDEIVAFAEFEQFLDTPVKRYSSGMYVRLAFAVAAHLEPEILIVDEVLAVGDAEFQNKCLGRLQQVASGDGRTVLFVSHNMGAIRRLCQRAIYLRDGHVESVGPTDQVVAQYLNNAVQSSATDLLNRPRFFGLNPAIAAFTARPDAGQQHLASGAPASFEIECRIQQNLKHAGLGIMFDSDLGHRVLALNTRLEWGAVALAAGRRKFVCRVDKLPLSPGRYSVELIITSAGQVVDCVERAASLDIQFGDFFGNGQSLMPYEGRLLHRSHWTSD